ncbi:hypothetical protein IJS64_01765 [bacterium]|nr:hypothetical protein [bacterium]
MTMSNKSLYKEYKLLKLLITQMREPLKLDDLQKKLIAFFKQNKNQEGLTLREIAANV